MSSYISFLINLFCNTENLLYTFQFDNDIKKLFLELSKYIKFNSKQKCNISLSKFIIKNQDFFKEDIEPSLSFLNEEIEKLRKIYKSNYSYPKLNNDIDLLSFFDRTKVYYTKNDDIDLVKIITLVREPCNIEKTKYFNTNKMLKKYGWDEAYYDTYYKNNGKLAPNIGIYCYTPLVNDTNKYIHVYNAIGYAFDSKQQSDYDFLIKKGINKLDLKERYKNIFTKIYDCAREHSLSHVLMSGVGAGNFAKLYYDGKRKGSTQFIEKIWIVAFKEVYNKYKIKTEFIDKNSEDSIFTRLTGLKSLGLFPDNISKIENLEKTLFVNAWDPLSFVGNGNNEDNSLDGYIGRNTYCGVLCTPIFNNKISYKEVDVFENVVGGSDVYEDLFEEDTISNKQKQIEYFNKEVKEYLPLLKKNIKGEKDVKGVSIPEITKDIFLIQNNIDNKKLEVIDSKGSKISFILQKQLGLTGKEGSALLYKYENDNSKEIICKVFKPKKSLARIVEETILQKLCNDMPTKYRNKVAPDIYGIIPNFESFNIIKGKTKETTVKDGPKILMEKMDKTLVELVKEQGDLTVIQQYKLLYLALSLDMKGFYHCDPNPLNYMLKGDEFYQIDFGMSKLFNIKTKGLANLRALNTAFFGGAQGLCTHKECKEPLIIKKYTEKYMDKKYKTIDKKVEKELEKDFSDIKQAAGY